LEPLLYLTHRIPFPPNKGDKIRSFHVLEFLASRYRVHLGTFVDDARDLAYVDCLRDYCDTKKVVALRPALARVRSLLGLLAGEALSLRYYRDAGLAEWVRTVVREHGVRKAVVFSSAMAQYVADIEGLRVVVDFVDVDSAKWTAYGRTRTWPWSRVYEREGACLLAFERSVAAQADASIFVTAAEAGLFRRLAPECAARVWHVGNGVDVAFFSPATDLANPFAPGEEPIVFTGAMDYWPNIDAVNWFVHEVLPTIVAERPAARFYIVGMRPAAAVRALSRRPGVFVTGAVPDTRPYLRHARVVVAPLRVARGIQNKVLEAMAMAKAVVVSTAAADGLGGLPGAEYETAAEAPEFASKTLALMRTQEADAMGAAARERVASDYGWTANLQLFEAILDGRMQLPAH